MWDLGGSNLCRFYPASREAIFMTSALTCNLVAMEQL